MTDFAVLVEADLTGTNFGDTPTFTDITADVLSTGIGSPITVKDWRQDEDSDVAPTVVEFDLDNTDGDYTPGAAGCVPGAIFRVSVNIDGLGWRSLGTVMATSFTERYVDTVQPVTHVVGVDMFAKFGTATPLRSILHETILANAALYLPLDDEDGTTAPEVLTGHSRFARIFSTQESQQDYAFGVVDTAFADPVLYLGQFGDDGDVLDVKLHVVTPVATTGHPKPHGVRVTWRSTTQDDQDGWIVNLRDGAGDGANHMRIGISGGFVCWQYGNGNIDPDAATITTRQVGHGRPHDFHLIHNGDIDSPVVRLYIDGELIDSDTLPPFATTWQRAQVGGFVSLYTLSGRNLVSGEYAHLAVYNQSGGTLTPAADEYTARHDGFAGETTDEHIARLLTYRANSGTDLDVGVGTVGEHNTGGITLQQALLETAKAEEGVVYVDGDGALAFRNRTHLFNPAAAVTLDASLAEIDTDTVFRVDEQDVVNDVTITHPNGSDQRVTDDASVERFGTRDGSDARIVHTDQAALDIANFLVATGATPLVRTPNVTVNMFTIDDASVADDVLAVLPLDRITVTNLPDTAPAIDVLVQGRDISLAVDAFDVTFYTSPLPPPVLVADDPVLGVCDDVNVAAF